MYLVLGTYTSQSNSKGVYICEFNSVTKAFTVLSSYKVSNPSFVAVKGELIYAVTENNNPKECFLIALHFNERTKEITELNRICLERSAPCYVSINQEGNKAIVASYLSGSITVIGLNNNGSLSQVIQQIDFKGKSIHQARQTQSHLHCVVYSVCQQYVLACDLGADCIYTFKVDDKQKQYLTLVSITKVKPGSGPRHLCFSLNGRRVYVINELSDTIMVFSFAKDKGLELIQEISCDNFNQGASADIHVHASGKFLFASVRGKDSRLVSYQIDSEKGTLTKFTEYTTLKSPRNFLISPLGDFVFVGSELEDTVQVFAFDRQSDDLTLVTEFFQVPAVTCIQFFK